ncbi:hypothetical protein DY000_02018205 [Brassica cretica]|uniref:Uncharacterized protein n=1 Tax=Brassica cretica TaxID=69181 RepID=A0ABQ7CNN7_BRACR|nr:hypothetical protein DY000_02018205 [Brassica cretica]
MTEDSTVDLRSERLALRPRRERAWLSSSRNEGVKLVAAEDKDGNVGFWNLDCQNEEEDGGVSVQASHLFSYMSCLSTKLFLKVPCLRRAASVAEEYEAAGGEVLVDDEDDDDKGNEDENLPSMVPWI